VNLPFIGSNIPATPAYGSNTWSRYIICICIIHYVMLNKINLEYVMFPVHYHVKVKPMFFLMGLPIKSWPS
jgi:hypothetical protein